MAISLEEIAKRRVEAFNKKDLHALMALYAEGCVNAQPHVPAPLQGKRATEENIQAFMKAFPDGHMEAMHVVTHGDTVAMEWTFRGTNRGPLAGAGSPIPPTGKTVNVRGAEFTRHNAQGLIVDQRGYFDLAGFMAQLGVSQTPNA